MTDTRSDKPCVSPTPCIIFGCDKPVERHGICSAHLSSQSAGTRIPEGWKLVPIKATKEMLDAGFDAGIVPNDEAVWDAMVAAAPEFSQSASEASKDAERYRFLKSFGEGHFVDVLKPGYSPDTDHVLISGGCEMLDDVIDEAMNVTNNPSDSRSHHAKG